MIILDFGIARVVSTGGQSLPRARARRSARRGYLSRSRRARNEKDLDTRADVFSLAEALLCFPVPDGARAPFTGDLIQGDPDADGC